MKIFLQHSSRENHWDQVSPWRQCQGRREGVSSGSAETSAPFRAGTGPSEMAREEPTGTGASGNEGLEAGNGGEVGAEQMLEPKKVKSDGRQRPLGMWGGSAAGLRTQITLFPKGNFFFSVTGEKKESMLINFI